MVLGQLLMNSFGSSTLMRETLESICFGNDWYGVTYDFDDYVQVQKKVDETWKDRKEWIKRSIRSTSGMGEFSSDTSYESMNKLMYRILNYCSLIWNVEPSPRPDYYKQKTSRRRSRSYPHTSLKSTSDDYIGLKICYVC